MSEVLRAPHEVVLSYRRSVGGADEVFLSGLARREIWGSRDAAGHVTVPPVDWDGRTGVATDGFVRVSDRGVVRSWAWIAEPPEGHPMAGPFALALIDLEGTSTALLHYVDSDEESMATGMAVRAEWREETAGGILDIRAFVAVAGDTAVAAAPDTDHSKKDDGERYVASEAHLRYTFEPGVALTGFLRALAQGRIEGGRCPSCGGVYVPPRPRCPACRTGPLAPAAVAEQGTVVACTEVHIPFPGLTLDLPFTCAWIRLDGADVPFAHLLGELGPGGAEVGQRVEAVWAAPGDLGPTWESIRYFRPASDVGDAGDAGGTGGRP